MSSWRQRLYSLNNLILTRLIGIRQHGSSLFDELSAKHNKHGSVLYKVCSKVVSAAAETSDNVKCLSFIDLTYLMLDVETLTVFVCLFVCMTERMSESPTTCSER